MTEEDFRELVREKYGDKADDLDEEGLERLESLFNSKMDKFGDERLALTSAIGSFNFEENNTGDGEEVTFYPVGSNGPRKFQGPTLFVYGILNPEDDDPGRCVILMPEDSVEDSLESYRELFAENRFKPFNSILDFELITSVPGCYKAEIGRRNDVFELDESLDEFTDEERKELVDDNVPTAPIAEVSDHVSWLKDSGKYPAGFGVDFRRINYATVLESAVTQNGARYVLQDDSFIDAADLPPEVRGEDDELGLVGWTEPEVMALNQESIVDAYGTISPNRDGQPQIRIYGYDGHYVQEASVSGSSSGSDDSGSSDSTTSGQPAEERTI